MLIPGKTVATGFDLILDRLDEATASQSETNRAQARLWASLAELMRLARANPHVYLRSGGLTGRDALELAEEAAAFDAGLRLHLSAGQVRTLAHRAQLLEDRLPRLRAVFAAGETTTAHVGAALDLLSGWDDDTAVRLFDEQLAEPAGTLTPAAFRARARRAKEKLHEEPAEARHARAFAGRGVWMEPAENGMAWVHALLSAPDAVRIVSRLNATSRAEQKKTKVGDSNWRSRDQIRADLAAAWLAGDGTPTAAKVRPVLLVPLLSMIGGGDEPIELRGYGTIDRDSAARLFAEAPSFRRVATNPFTGEKLTYDRERYRPTQAQKDWIAFRFENCIDPTCNRAVDDTDVDHLEEWVRDNGRTNEDNLFPLCEKSNRRKNLSRFDYERLPNGRVSITTPTGLTVTTEAAPF
ncbi:HNH endonuclease signature motif containing protein [Glaciibacter superstes]|uniref:HNH endonuclease signature motif containing protein n=2 Tax=Glaciibacter superstes TaxID=501023 RepID=UPI0003B4B6FC|nr:HNH endonuclease signature motif containing protein [Glaciibacter superstes]